MVVPQMLRTLRNRTMPGVSALSWGLLSLTCTAWLLYGVRTGEVPQIPGNVLLVSGAVVIALAVPSARTVRARAAGLLAAAFVLVLLAVVAPVEVIGAIALSGALVSSVPQTITSLTRKDATRSAVSPLSWVLRIASQTCWLTYALALHDVTVTVSAIVILSNAIIVLVRETTRSAAGAVAQVQHPVALDDDVRVVQQVLGVDGAEEALARTEHDGHHVHADDVDEPAREGLPAHVASRDRDVAVAGQFLSRRDRLTHVGEERH
jgi:uncharacterized protein with PQ loop repeat